MIELRKKIMITILPGWKIPKIEYEILNLPEGIKVEFDEEESNYCGTIKSITVDSNYRGEDKIAIMRKIMSFNSEIINTNIENRIEFAPRVKRI